MTARQMRRPARAAVLVAHALVGWMYCGALVGIGSLFMSIQATLVVHAIGAPLGFVFISFFYFRKFSFTKPFETALMFVGFVVAMDIVVVALLVEKSFAMFASPLGTWIPLALIFSATYFTGRACTRAPR